MTQTTDMPPTGPRDVYWDPFDPALRDEPYALWRRLRDEAPCYHNDRYDFYVLSRYADVAAAHLDVRTYISSHGTSLELMGPDPIPGGQIIFLDPPEHTRLRALVSRAFTPRRMAALDGRIREICRGLLDARIGAESFDYVQDFGAIVPPTVISSLLGVPESDQEELRHVVDAVFHIEDGVGMVNETSLNAIGKIDEYLVGQIRDRRANPRDDMLSALATAEVADEHGEVGRLSSAQAADFGKVLFIAGTETVARLIGWAGSVLATHPDQRAELAADPSLIPGAIEELLRYEAPSPVQARWTTAAVEMHGTTIPAGSKVVLLTGAAGRDERKYPDPDRFDIHREFDHHVSFGHGIHFCIGAALARTEGRIALEETLRRWPTWEVDHDEAELLYTSTVRGYEKLPIHLPAMA
jgi:cytochrome P450